MAHYLQRLPTHGKKWCDHFAEILERMMFFSFAYLIFSLITGCLYFLNYVINRHYSNWDTDFMSSRVLRFVRVEYLLSSVLWMMLTPISKE